MNGSLRLIIFSTTSLLLASGCKLPADSCVWSLKPSAEYDDVTDDVINTNPSDDSQLLIVMTSRLMSSQLIPYLAHLYSSAESSC
ncbi:hypothetical protein F511_27335 [Dorcoceras hygrometricum]|uniref:Uncharacterized protein n=1 Tax=Dorcoceras hygrometricum TaxID=472368 RepID=A0A2Z7BDS4_9LAMI|nr:hypothetical protein F511_27335 [Dorcoceras hygrometricum]